MDKWFNERYSEVVDATEMAYEEMPIPEMTITLATESAQAAASHGTDYAAAFGVLAMGAFAGAYFMYKKNQTKASPVDKTSLLEQDLEFSQV